jgi:hypothetical protein
VELVFSRADDGVLIGYSVTDNIMFYRFDDNVYKLNY